jgi:hypothetical protein
MNKDLCDSFYINLGGTIMSENNCPVSCHECFLLGETIPDWPQRLECKKLEKLREQLWEDEGGAIKKEEEEVKNE